MHACPCGFFGDPTRECRCTPAIIQRYLGKISGPLLDRIDIQIEVPAVPYKELRSEEFATSSEEMRGRAQRATEIQRARGYRNVRMPMRSVRKDCALNEMAMRRLSLSARTHDRILKVARTVADLDRSDSVAPKRFSTAVWIGTTGTDAARCPSLSFYAHWS
jgi:magnesium chelatase family protein